MNRPRRYCCYRDCDTNSFSNPERTLFQFPKDEVRANKWLEAGAIEKVDSSPRFMCDLHFSRIYMCFSSRRKMLLNTAVPYPYGVSDEDQDQEQVQSTSQDIRDEESLSDQEHEMHTEILYVDSEEIQEPEEISDERTVVIKRPLTTSPGTHSKAKLLKIEKFPTAARSTVVSSSSPSTKSDPLKTTSAPEALILRKIKLKKASKPAEANSEKIVVMQKTIKIEEENDASKPLERIRSSLSLSPAKKSPQRNAEHAENPTGTTQTPQPVLSPASSSSSKTPLIETSIQTNTKAKEKNESIYEFIFKGEEYVQLPKAQYVAEKQEIECLVDQSQQEKCELQKQLDYYRKIVNQLKLTLQDVPE
ncbi:uncharacterized protein LOC129776813 isoform X2 [Toxorhynchites rutilus septentrionalis]|uniref:uncharacterized protein LOC129776813 isoform X2 n=1 Tax=Toxorhynchites rutilus septentrionalis TaxID=329112 RepID=UPI0024796464|nr:uncharacterized protein LOC129776813 isoform X2 [Toxorhynchites rutilus septentrionalis]